MKFALMAALILSGVALGQCPNGKCPNQPAAPGRIVYTLPAPVATAPVVTAPARAVDADRLAKALAKMRAEGRAALTEAEFNALFK